MMGLCPPDLFKRQKKFTGWTNKDGTRRLDAPVGWPFGKISPEDPQYAEKLHLLRVRPRNRYRK